MRKSLALLIALLAFAPAAWAAASREVHKVLPLNANGHVSIDSHNGSVTVLAWNQPNVGVDAVIEPQTGNTDDDVQKTNIKITGGGSSVDIVSDFSAVEAHVTWLGISHTSPLVHYTVHVPPTAALKVDVHNASIKVTGIRNDVNLQTHNGTIEVTDLDGAARLETHNGSVRVAFTNMPRASRVETHNGSVDIDVPATAKLTVVADAHRSNPLSSDMPVNLKASGSQYTASINGGGPELKFVTHNGSLHIGKR